MRYKSPDGIRDRSQTMFTIGDREILLVEEIILIKKNCQKKMFDFCETT